ncbi:elongation factor Tu [Cellulophaga baltica]|uniref:elongation factor Tu n=1 Tax=Cellulophaga baltica TaxID=76594 RepID=UPI0015F6D7E6|nr:elongation factor Tu [Cellulophaga baltica]MBA6316887.1 elongation factor Tu [Cellulophaga baltica]
MKQIDFIAELEFSTTEQGGRINPAYSGYRPHIEFENYPEYLTSGQQTYIGQEVAELGTKVKAEIAILGTEYFAKRLYENMEFKFCEGSRTIGFGKIMEIINTDLKCESGIEQKTINLNLYPTDIKNRLESDYGKNSGEAKIKIQELIISNKEFRSERIVRALIYTGNKDIVHLEKMIELTRTDWRDLLMNAEYEYPEKRVRDFNNEFGNEKIKASR